ncbi:hypothetical protein SDC9_125235 [bioreactor metagenome]|uniref:Uncharacterized protein n=1 Tax=bioreactor metagenome TaxID=1076179 RepID=A0A645CMW1_9ZZZZ
MGPVHKPDAHQRGFRTEYLGVYLVQRFPAHVVIAVSGGSPEAVFRHPEFLKGGQNTPCILLRHNVNRIKLGAQSLLRFSSKVANPLVYL